MLPDLDKPSLKEMGITLMGDMIAILRYAKKVVEETTCERFLVDSEDKPIAPLKIVAKPAAKKPAAKEIGSKTVISTLAGKTEPAKKVIKPLSTTTKKIITVKKPIAAPNATNAEHVSQKQQISVKRKLISEEMYDSKDEDSWNATEKKKVKAADDGEDDGLEYPARITMPKTSSVRVQQILKKHTEQKRTVFDRLGDSSVTSTTNLADPTFNVTGIGKDVFKRSTSVFKRLGDIDDKKDGTGTAGILKNGTSSTAVVTGSSPGILKNRTSGTSIRTSIVTTKRIAPKTTGTMHADHEASNKKILLNSTSRILKLEKKIVSDTTPSSGERISTVAATPGKLGMYARTAVWRCLYICMRDNSSINPLLQCCTNIISNIQVYFFNKSNFSFCISLACLALLDC